jgi:hypothetical protein
MMWTEAINDDLTKATVNNPHDKRGDTNMLGN